MHSPEFKLAFQKSIPIMTGFLFLAAAYGIYMHQMGFNFLYPTLMAATIFGGSVEFVVANLLLGKFNPWLVFFLTFIINARHLFYGLSMLNKYDHTGWKKYLLIFGMCDETFAINYATKVPAELDEKKFMLYVTMLNYFYWVLGAFLGGVLGSLMTFKLPNLDFVMTALFLVLFTSQFTSEKHHFSSLTGIVVAVMALFVFGEQWFLLPSLVVMVAILAIKKHREGVVK